MKNLVFLYLLFISSGLYAENPSWDSLLMILNKNELTYLELDSFLERKSDSKAKKKTIFANVEFRRLEFENLIQTVYTIHKIKRKKNRESYLLKYFLLEDKVVHVRLSNLNSKTTIFNKSTDTLDKYLNNHFDELNIEVDRDHKYFLPSDRIVVGFACGFGGEPRFQFKEMVELVRNRNKMEIVKWCNSISPEIRYYGGIGLDALRELEVELTKQETLILEAISNEKTEIYTCSGCTGWGLKFPINLMFQGGGKIILKWL